MSSVFIKKKRLIINEPLNLSQLNFNSSNLLGKYMNNRQMANFHNNISFRFHVQYRRLQISDYLSYQTEIQRIF